MIKKRSRHASLCFDLNAFGLDSSILNISL